MKLDPEAAADTRTPEQIEIDRLRSELDHFTKFGIIEVAVRNPSVSEYMEHWEGRALKAEAEIARRALPQSQDIRALVEALRDVDVHNADELWMRAGLLAQAADALERLSCLAGEGWRPKVRPLDWKQAVLGSELSRADTMLGPYRVWTHHEADGKWFWCGVGEHFVVATEAKGKAAAQADFDRRILSALDLPAPSVEEKLP